MQDVTIDNNLNQTILTDSSARETVACADSGDKFRIQIFGKDDIAVVFELWRKLESQFASFPLMCSADWTETWFNCYQETINTHFVAGFDGDKICGICLVTESTSHRIGPLTVRSLHLGTAGEANGESVCVEYNQILCEPRFESRFLLELQKFILDKEDWDRVQLDGIPCGSDQVWPDFLHTKKSVRVRESRYFDLDHCRENGSDILAMLGKSTRSNIKRRIKKLGEFEVQWAQTCEQAVDIFNELIQLHQQRWQNQGQPGAFASDRFTKFQKQLIEKLLPQQKVVLCRIKAGEQTVGCLYLLVDGRRMLDYVSGLASFESIPSSGLISHYLCMNEALNRGYQAYDFLVGDKRHKENLGKSSNQLQWVICERNRAIFGLRNMALQAKHLIKRIVKKS
ncbi:MAG: GNAT family N-acetyltransferase [Planctomycetaceae bacterium]|nr:GNAT family N-acetyltransferase [Planctomycetaceae bacterium]